MQGGNNNFHGPKWGPILRTAPLETPNHSQEFQGGGPLFLSRSNGGAVPSWEGQSPRWRGHGVAQDFRWSSPPPPGVSPRSHKGMRIGLVPSVPVICGSPPNGHINGGSRRLSNSPSNLGGLASVCESVERGRRSTGSSDTRPFPLWGDGAGRKRNGEQGDKLGVFERVAQRVYSELLAQRKGITTGKVAQETLEAMGVASYDSVGVLPNEIPTLRKLALLEGKVNAFIHSHVAGKKITTLYDLSVDLTRDECVKDFEDLELGPLLCHPLVGHYFTPPVGAEIHKITAGEVVQLLSDYIGNMGKDTRVQIENFLAFIQKERSLPSPQHLCIKIQSLGMHIGFIRRAKKAEKELISIWESRARVEFDKKQKPGVFERVQNFLASADKKKALTNGSLGKRKFPFIDNTNASEDDVDDEDQVEVGPRRSLRLMMQRANLERKRMEAEDDFRLHPMHSTTSCPYPSAAEERARSKKQDLRLFIANSEQDDFYLSGAELQDFVSILKDACENRSVHEVLMKMIEMSRKFKGTKKRSGKSKIFKAYPAIGLLNVAVLSVKAGFWDSMYNNFLTVLDGAKQQATGDSCSVETAVPADKSGDENPGSIVKEPPSLGQIIAAVLEHYDDRFKSKPSEESIDGQTNQPKRLWELVRWTFDCETWICEKFSVATFASIGFGIFPEFLEQNVELLSGDLISFIQENTVQYRTSAKIPKERLFSFLTQALPSVTENGVLSQENLMFLLRRQFNVEIEELGAASVSDILRIHQEQLLKLAANSHMHFLSPLVGASGTSSQIQDSGEGKTATTKDYVDSRQTRVGILGSMSDLDACRSLERAPYLTDLLQWSQWDEVFAPTLGPLLNWLEREGMRAGLHALVTCSGGIFRIDSEATPESFLHATVSGKGDLMAAALTSVIALYGGIKNCPMALLKSHASKGLEIYVGSLAGNLSDHSLTRSSATGGKRKLAEVLESQVETAPLNNSISSMKSLLDSGTAGGYPSVAVARCVLECLTWMIPEFRLFAAEILLQALSSMVPRSSTVLLSCCVTHSQTSILQGLGLGLGISEWINDYNKSVAGLPVAADMGTLDLMDVDQFTLLPAQEVPKNMALTGADIRTEDDQKIFSQTDTESIRAYKQQLPVCKEIALPKVKVQRTQSGNVGPPTRNTFEEDNSLEVQARRTIEEIRRNEFGIGLDISGTDRELLTRQHARMGRALHRLSSDLYSQDSHFVLELVQNADDNSYAASVEAALIFLIQEGRIVVLNNEMGFTAVNMQALCDVGNSTKAGLKTGYIGHKGIGFKSVFRVTNSPEIHSNGYHVKFDITEGDIGFILPTIVPCPPACRPLDDIFALMPKAKVQKVIGEGWNTRIDLPIKESLFKGGGMNHLGLRFDDLHPSLLLFLHRLRCIAVRNEVTGSIVVMHREDLGDDLVKVGHEKASSTWMVVRRKLEASLHRPGITCTEIALGFQLNEVSKGLYEACCEQQEVFAFLPLRGYGLRFIVQGDFIVPSSREEVDCDSDWNQWLRTEIPDLFIQSAQSFRKLMAFSGNPGKAISSFMSFVPMEGEVLGFFSPMPRMIMARLRATACLPVQGGGWALPCVLLRGWNEQTRELFPDVFLKEYLGLSYIDEEVILSDILALKLGVQQFGAGTLVAVMKSVCSKEGALKKLGIKWVEAWLTALYDCLESDKVSRHSCSMEDRELPSSIKSELQSLPFIPLSTGTVTSLSDGPVWFTGEMSQDGLALSSTLSRFPLISSELRTVHQGLLSGPGDEFSQNRSQASHFAVGKVVTILQKLGVSRISSHDVIRSHILPIMESEDCMTKQPLLVAEYLGFFLSHLEGSCISCFMEKFKFKGQLQKSAVIVTSHGLIRVGQQPIHFSTVMGNPFQMNKVLDGTSVKWVEISPLYMQLQAVDCEAVTKWRAFFKDLGVTDFVQVIPLETKVTEKCSSPWSQIAWEGENGYEGGWIVQDWQSPELTVILSVTSTVFAQEIRKARALLAGVLGALDRLWDDYYFQFCMASYRPATASESWRKTCSSFKLQLQQSSWVMSTLGDNFQSPLKLFRICDGVRSILGSHAPYLSPAIQNEKFMEALGLRTQVRVEDVLLLLRRWSTFKKFRASVAQMTRLYSFVLENISVYKDDILAVFATMPSIFVPVKWNGAYEDVQFGTFHSSSTVCWNDPTQTLSLVTLGPETVLSLPVTPLSSCYPALRNFFVEECRVQEKPSFDGYLEVLKKVASEKPPSAVLDKVMGLFCMWSSDIASGKVVPVELLRWNKRFEEVDSRVLPTNQDKWVSMNHQECLTCICDDETLGEEFRDSMSNINFLLLRDEDLLKTCSQVNSLKAAFSLQPLVQALGIPKLSEVVDREVIKYGLHDNGRIKALIRWALPYAQRYMRHHHADQYKCLQAKNIVGQLKNIGYVVVDQLFFQYSLRNSSVRSCKRTPSTCLLQGSTLHVVENFLPDYCNIYVELSRLFFSGKSDLGFANFLHLITLMTSSGSSEKEVEKFVLNIQSIPPVPREDELWVLDLKTPETSPEADRTTPGLYLERHINLQHLRKKVARGHVSDGWPPHSWKPVLAVNTAAVSTRAVRETPDEAMTSPTDRLYITGTVSANVNDRTHEDTVFDRDNGSSMFGGCRDKPEWDGLVEQKYGTEYAVRAVGLSWTSQPVNTCAGDGSSAATAANWQLSSLESRTSLQPEAAQPVDVQEVTLDGNDRKLISKGVVSETLQNFQDRDFLGMQPLNDQQRELTGRSGEALVFRYLVQNYGAKRVKWINKECETGAAYDILLNKESGEHEYIEVKATRSGDKDWFEISPREWEFARQHAECFTIIRVFFGGSDHQIKIVRLPNPVKLAQDHVIQLALLLPATPTRGAIVSENLLKDHPETHFVSIY